MPDVNWSELLAKLSEERKVAQDAPLKIHTYADYAKQMRASDPGWPYTRDTYILEPPPQ
jgi:hypothetical protein